MSDDITEKASTSDIYGYVLFACIDKRNGKIQGHRVLLSDEQYSQIEDIVCSDDVKVLDEAHFEFDSDDGED